MELRITPNGNILAVFGEEIPLKTLGDVKISRASHVEPTDGAMWAADLAPVGGPVLGPFETRTEALEAEVAWLHKHLIGE